MDLKAYISSGILEQYLLGLLSESEAREVEQVVAAYPEIRAELNAMEDALAQYAMARGISMPENLPDRIVQKLDTLDRELPGKKDGSGRGSGAGNLNILLGILLAAAIAGLVFLFFRISQLSDDLDQVNSNLQQLQVQCDQVQDSLDQLQLQLAILRSEGNRTFIMRGNENNPGAIANVYYNTEAGGSAYLDIRELPSPPTGQQYQLWGIGSAGVQSLGVFDIPQGPEVTFIPVPYLPDIDVFAISLEPAGGSPTPTEVHLISAT